MGRRKPVGRPINGWLVIDKAPGMTSTQVVSEVKRLTEAQIKQISDENRLRESEYALSRGDAESALQQARHRFGGWVFFLDGE